MWTRESLVEHIVSGAAVQYLFFWGHTPKVPGVVDSSCLSQWYPSSFVVDGITYPTAETFMMAEKARLFGDDATLAKILAATTPAHAKALGREVASYVDTLWSQNRTRSVVKGNVAKFSQDQGLKKFLLETGNKVLVEASPRDTIWGIGMGANNPAAMFPDQWRGQNLLGFALMDTRAQL